MNDTTMRMMMIKILKAAGFTYNQSLRFSSKNRKIHDAITLSLPAGHSCPFAKDCRSCATVKTTRSRKGKSCGFGIQDGPHTQFRCFAAIDEVMRPNVRISRWHNYLLLLWATKQGLAKTIELIENSLPAAKFVPTRIHVSGDFFCQTYFDAWLEVCRRNPKRIFYAYTKALPLWVKRINVIPANLHLVASYGGTHDYLIAEHGLKSATVVESPEAATVLGLEIDHDDSHCYESEKSFALVVHGQQPAGSKWAKAWSNLKKRGLGGYGKQRKNTVNHKA